MIKEACYACGFCTLCDRCPLHTYKDDQGTETICRCLSNDKATLDGSDCPESPWDSLPCELPSRMKLSTEFWYTDVPELQKCDTNDCTDPDIRNVQCNQWLGYFGEVQVSGCTKTNRTAILSGCSIGSCDAVYLQINENEGPWRDNVLSKRDLVTGAYSLISNLGTFHNLPIYVHDMKGYFLICRMDAESGQLYWAVTYEISDDIEEVITQAIQNSCPLNLWIVDWGVNMDFIGPMSFFLTSTHDGSYPSLTTSSGGLFSVKGKCEVDGDCATSRNYPQPYGMLEHCEINMLQDADIRKDLFFINSEGGYDQFSLDGVGMDSWEGLPSHVNYGQTFRWSSDSMIAGSLNSNEGNIGWKICFEKPESSYDENCTYTIDDRENSRSFEITDSEIRLYTEHSILAGIGTFDDGYEAGNLCNRLEEEPIAHSTGVVVTWLEDPECSQEDNIAVSAASCIFVVSLCPCAGRKREDCTYNATQVSVPNVRLEISNEEVWYHETVMNLVGKGSYSTGVYINGDPCSGQHDETDWGAIQNRRSARIVWMDSTANDCDYVTQDMQCIYSVHICPCNVDSRFNFNAVVFGETVVFGLLIISIVSGIIFIYRFVKCCANQLKKDDHEDVELFDLYQNIIEEQSDAPVDSIFAITSDSDAPVDSIFPTISDSEGGDCYIDSDLDVSDPVATASITLGLTDWRHIRDFLDAQEV